MSSNFELVNAYALEEALSEGEECFIIIRCLKELYKVCYDIEPMFQSGDCFPAVAFIGERYVVGFADFIGNGVYEFEEYNRQWLNRGGKLHHVESYDIVAWLDRCSHPSFRKVFKTIKSLM